MLEKQIIQLNDGTKGIASEIDTLYSRIHSKPANTKLEEQGAFLQKEKIEINERRKTARGESYWPEGKPPKG